MFSQDSEQEHRVVAVVLVAVIVLAVGLALGVGISKSRGKPAPAPAAPVTAVAEPAAPAAEPAADAASVTVDNGVVKFYFASGKADLAQGALEALAEAIAAGKASKQLVISGFHDAVGDPAANAELAKQRALAVRDALVAAGVPETAVQLKKPEESTGSGSNAQARRVEVMIAP